MYLALGASLLVTVTRFSAAARTGSSAMFSEGIQPVADMGTGLLLLYGLHRGATRPNHEHTFGYGRQVYFWSFTVAILVFALGAGVSPHEGITQVMNAVPIPNGSANYVALGLT